MRAGRVTCSQGPKDLIRKQILKGEIHMKPVMPDGISEGQTAAKLMISGAGAYTFSPEAGVCKTVDDSGEVKVFEVNLPTTGAADMVHVLTYTGPVPEGNTPCLIECAAVRSDTTTTSSLTVGDAAGAEG